MAFNLSEVGITQQANTPGLMTPIVVYKIPAGAKVIWPKITRIIMKLYNTNGDELNKKTELLFQFKLPADKTWTPLTEVFTYHIFSQMSLADQSDSMKTPTIKLSPAAQAFAAQIDPEAEAIAFKEDRIIALFINSSDTYDPSNVNNFLELPDVEVKT